MAREVARLPVTSIGGETGFRYADYDTPLWARNNQAPARWHRPGDGATQYIALHPDGAWAELLRHENLRTGEEAGLVRTKVWALSLDQSNVVDYSTFAKAKAAGFDEESLVDDDYSRCQEEGRRLRGLGYAGVLAPSAALPDAVNLTIFGRRFKTMWRVPTRLASAIPTCLVAVGSPPTRLVERVRFFGEQHLGHDRYRADGPGRDG